MEPITLIAAALAAGSSGGAISALQDDLKGAVVAVISAQGLPATSLRSWRTRPHSPSSTAAFLSVLTIRAPSYRF